MLRSAAASSARCISQSSRRLLSKTPVVAARQDTDYVKRRYGYREEMKQKRRIFAEEIRSEQSKNVKDQMEDRQKRLEAKRAREERKRAVSAGKQEEHLKRLAEVKARKEERVAFNFELWTKKQADLAAKRQESFESVVQASKNWVTDDTLDRHVERAVDAFFIAEDASKHGFVRQGGV